MGAGHCVKRTFASASKPKVRALVKFVDWHFAFGATPIRNLDGGVSLFQTKHFQVMLHMIIQPKEKLVFLIPVLKIIGLNIRAALFLRMN